MVVEGEEGKATRRGNVGEEKGPLCVGVGVYAFKGVNTVGRKQALQR